MIIRNEHPDDHAAIAELTAIAFRDVEHRDQTEAAIIDRLRAAGALALSLVAVEVRNIVGHIAFSPVQVKGIDCGYFGLGPVSVNPHLQRQGIGTALIRRGLAELRGLGAVGCVVLGEPAYYSRFGFKVDEHLLYEDAPPEYFMHIKLKAGENQTGKVEYHPAFNNL